MSCEEKKCEYLVTSDHYAASFVSLYTCLAGAIPKQYPPSPDHLRSEFCNDNFEQCGRYINAKRKKDQEIGLVTFSGRL